MPDMSPNAYAILGLLAARPWSAYELARHMKTSSNLRQIWPRAESKIYQAPKDLEAVGWARSRKERSGGRQRRVYRITPAGRRALRRWLDEPPARPYFELEAALKVAYATAGSIEQLRHTLLEMRAIRTAVLAEMTSGVRTRLDDDGFAMPDRLHTSALVAEMVSRLAKALKEWREWASGIVDEWEDLEIDSRKHEWALETYRRLLAEAEAELAAENARNRDGT